MSNVNKTLTMIKNYDYYWSNDTTNRLNDIALMQQALNNMGYSCGIADGVYGSNTVTGVKAFQTAKGLTSDGLFGPASLTQLENSLHRPLDQGTIYIGRVNDSGVAVRNKPSASGSTVYGRYREDMWCAARKVPGTTQWYATH